MILLLLCKVELVFTDIVSVFRPSCLKTAPVSKVIKPLFQSDFFLDLLLRSHNNRRLSVVVGLYMYNHR